MAWPTAFANVRRPFQAAVAEAEVDGVAAEEEAEDSRRTRCTQSLRESSRTQTQWLH